MLNRTRRWLGAQAPFAVVVAVLIFAFLYLVFQGDHWRRGVGIVTLGLFVAAVLRVVLPEHRAGMLVVRGRWRDAFCYLLLGVVILVAAIRVR